MLIIKSFYSSISNLYFFFESFFRRLKIGSANELNSIIEASCMAACLVIYEAISVQASWRRAGMAVAVI